PLGRGDHARVGHVVAAARAQLHVAATDPKRTAGVRLAAPGRSRRGRQRPTWRRRPMRTSVRFLVFAGVFGLVVGAVYWFLSAEQAGTVLLIMMGAAPLLIAGYLIWRAWNSRLAEDRPDANPEDAAGEPLGHFST